MALMTQLIDAEPSTYEQVAQHGVWQEAMMEEYASIMKNDVWEVVPRPKGKKVVGSKWIYKVKHATKWKRGQVQSTLRGQGVFTARGSRL
jgi:galactose-1-phosphate uridylyltransferase